MTKGEYAKLKAVLDYFEKKEDECWDLLGFMDEHKFNFEKQAADMKRQVYHECYRKLRCALLDINSDEQTEGGKQ